MSDQPVATVPGVTTNCDNEGSSTCGQFSWIIPSSWAGGNCEEMREKAWTQDHSKPSLLTLWQFFFFVSSVTLQASSESDPSIESCE